MLSASQKIRLIVSDVDGVWTDGHITYMGDQREIKAFHVRDGLGVKLGQKAGIETAVLTSRQSPALERRCGELGIRELVQGSRDKLKGMRDIGERLGVSVDEICYIGDDLPDLAPMRIAALSAAPSDAAPEVLTAASIKLSAKGGAGAFRELIELLLRERGEWDAIVREYAIGTLEAPAN